MGFPKNKTLEFTYEYDAEIDGGEIGAVNLRPVGNEMDGGLVVKGATFKFLTEFSTGGSNTMSVGNSDDADCYVPLLQGSAIVAGFIIYPGIGPAPVVWDDTNDHQILYKIPEGAGTPVLTIANDAVTSGRFEVTFYCERY